MRGWRRKDQKRVWGLGGLGGKDGKELAELGGDQELGDGWEGGR